MPPSRTGVLSVPFEMDSWLDEYERVVERSIPDREKCKALLQEGRRAYFKAQRNVGADYAEVLLEQMTNAVA